MTNVVDIYHQFSKSKYLTSFPSFNELFIKQKSRNDRKEYVRPLVLQNYHHCSRPPNTLGYFPFVLSLHLIIYYKHIQV